MKVIEANLPHIDGPLRLACFASGNASSFRRVVQAIEEGQLNATAALLISDKENAPALQFAREHNIPTLVINRRTAGDFEARDAKIRDELRAAQINLFILSGYTPRIGIQTLQVAVGLNGHPSLLPRHGGKGMHGRHVHHYVRISGDTVTGATVHVVDEQLDHGPILAQVEVPVFREDTDENIEARVKAEEPDLLLKSLQAIDGRRTHP